MQQKDQGFANDEVSELVDFKYQPQTLCVSKTIKKTLKSNQKKQCLNESPFIDQQHRQHWMLSNMGQSNKCILYNSFKQTWVNYQDPTISFDSNFESGNLDFVSKKKQNQYWLYIRPDTNTKTHFQWFFFKVKITDGPKKIVFVLKNFMKPSMLYSEGLRPYFKEKNSKSYCQIPNDVIFTQDDQHQDTYNLRFSFTFKGQEEEVYFSSQPPYTYKDLCIFVKTLKCQKLTISQSILDNKIPYLIFPQTNDCKVVGIAIARQHPGQSVSSWMIQGFLRRLNEKDKARNIRWIVIPMLNVDGVRLGNNRTGVLGHDLNRNWNFQQKKRRQNLFPEIKEVITLVKELKIKYRNNVKFFIDFHGHSSQSNVFSYGPPHDQSSDYYLYSRLFPEMINKKNKNFNLEQCSYLIGNSKNNTARSVFFYQLRIPFTYTIQSSFGLFQQQHTTIEDFIQIGSDIADASNQFLGILTTINDKKDSKAQRLLKQVEIKYKHRGTFQVSEINSGSQQSQQNQKRKQFEQNIEMLIKKPERKKEKRSMTQQRQKSNKLLLKLPLINYTLGKRIPRQSQHVSLRGSELRSQLPKQLNFIKQKIRYKKIFYEDNISMKDIHQRLLLLKNSKIGKRILVINPYGK